MGPDLYLIEKATSNVVSTNNNECVAQNQENKGNIGMEVDLIECVNSGESEMIDVECQECQNATECSSSFSDTVSGDENGLIANGEVESPLLVPGLIGSLSDGWSEPFQMGKRRLTDHWRRFIHPLMWRCKWLEIKFCELKSQGLKYERELAQYDQSKRFEFEKFTSGGFDARLCAFRSKAPRKEVMKRKKRKRVEDTADVASYMSHHDIFSYYENKKSAVAAPAALLSVDDWRVLDNRMVNGYDDDEFNDGWPFESRDGDNLTEQILPKIELLWSRIRTLKTRMDKVVNGTPQKFSSIIILSSLVPADELNNPESHCAEKDDQNSLQGTTSQHASEIDLWDNIMPESALLDHGEVTLVPDVIRSMSQRMLALSSENIDAEILIPNEAAKEELLSFGSAISHQVEKSKAVAVVVHAPRDNLQVNTALEPNAQPPFFKSKQADNERSSGVQRLELGRWSRKSSG
ncbi:uncharacterized protein LOC120179160 [Hibiscus syriacus]|uniref:uncharacterized protein LOC120179160 n=1 Tax=Hibiscus syriacus TaxID=106335 RepID=UPI0019206308|nr:uncharacterized protein LOC120179160 [Hibiscus syriacus]XP_039040772.1 uncharacterized protein LOC120179160 [Hibiscus syriacus]